MAAGKYQCRTCRKMKLCPDLADLDEDFVSDFDDDSDDYQVTPVLIYYSIRLPFRIFCPSQVSIRIMFLLFL